MQIIILTGNVGQAAEVRQVTGTDTKAISFSVATNKRYVTNDGEVVTKTTWFNCTKWVYKGGSTEVSKSLVPGTLVSLVGEISTHAYKNKEGNWIASLDLQVDKLELLSPGKKEDKPENEKDFEARKNG